MTPGQKVLKAFKERKYGVLDLHDPIDPQHCDDSEIAGIIEQESSIVELAKALEGILELDRLNYLHRDVLDTTAEFARAHAALRSYRDQA